MFVASTKGMNLTLTLDGTVLKQVCSTKYLGVYLDYHLTWQSHVDYVLGRVRGKLSPLIGFALQLYVCFTRHIYIYIYSTNFGLL